MARSSSYSWMPGWLRKFLNLDDELPGYGPSYSAQGDYAPPAPQRQSVSYTPPAASSYTPPAASSYTPPAATYTPPASPANYTPSYPATTMAGETTPRFAASYSPPPPPAGTADEPPARGVTAAPPPTPPRTLGPTGTVQAGGTVSPGGNPQGYVQPIGYGLRAYARGVLPPQGLEQFTREFRATMTDVWNFYSYWTRFQTDELVRIGRDAVEAVVDNLPSGPGDPGTGGGSAVRRIKVTVGNGNGEKKVDRVATTTAADPPPAPTPARPPAPPAPTASFSATVTADDAQVPPAGRDTTADFAARMATSGPASSAGAADPAAKDAAAKAKDAAAKAKDAADKPKGPDGTKSAG